MSETIDGYQPLCMTNCPLHTRRVVESSGVGDVIKVYCKASPDKYEPILVIDDPVQVQHFLAMAEMGYATHYAARFCIAPNALR